MKRLETFLHLFLNFMRRILTLILFIISFHGFSQNFLSWQFNDRYFSISAGTGSATYFGELNYDNAVNRQFSLVSIGLEARLLSKLGARIETNYLALDGQDADAPDNTFERQRNLSFESRNFQVRLDFIYYLKAYQGDYYKRWVFDPYLTTGIGYLRYTPAARFGGERFLLREAQTEGESYNQWAFTVPFGIGAKFRVNEFLNVNFEVLYHLAFTDYLDDVSKTYATEFANTTAEFLSDRKDEVGVLNETFYDQIQPGAPRGDSNTNDSFLLIGVKAELFLPPGLFSGRDKAILKKPSAY